MCKSKADGGQRCYPHAKAAYEEARQGLSMAQRTLDAANRYMAPHDGTAHGFRAAQRDRQLRQSSAVRDMKKATTKYEKAAAAFANTDRGRAELEEKAQTADQQGKPRTAARYRKEIKLGDKQKEQQERVETARAENKDYLVKGARLVAVKHRDTEIAHVVVGPADDIGNADVAYKGDHVATLERWEQTRDLSSAGSRLRVDGGTETYWTAQVAGQPRNRYARQHPNRNSALLEVVQAVDQAKNQNST